MTENESSSDSAEARRIVETLGLTDHVRRIADDAPPMPADAIDLWRRLRTRNEA